MKSLFWLNEVDLAVTIVQNFLISLSAIFHSASYLTLHANPASITLTGLDWVTHMNLLQWLSVTSTLELHKAILFSRALLNFTTISVLHMTFTFYATGLQN